MKGHGAGRLHPRVPHVAALMGALVHRQGRMESREGRRKLQGQTCRHGRLLEIRLFLGHGIPTPDRPLSHATRRKSRRDRKNPHVNIYYARKVVPTSKNN